MEEDTTETEAIANLTSSLWIKHSSHLCLGISRSFCSHHSCLPSCTHHHHPYILPEISVILIALFGTIEPILLMGYFLVTRNKEQLRELKMCFLEFWQDTAWILAQYKHFTETKCLALEQYQFIQDLISAAFWAYQRHCPHIFKYIFEMIRHTLRLLGCVLRRKKQLGHTSLHHIMGK